MDTLNNTLYLRRRSKICLPVPEGAETLPAVYIASMLKNIEALGFTFSEPLVRACQSLSIGQLTALYQELVAALRQAKGAHRQFAPMYPNFPAQVMETGEAELYLNAVLHYITGGRLYPYSQVEERLPLLDEASLQILDLGTRGDFERLFGQIAASNASLSEQDKEDLTWFAQAHGPDITRLLPDAIPQKENTAFVAGLLIRHTDNALPFVERFCRTSTDILRLAVALSGGDVSLAAAARFRSFTRGERNLLLGLLERQPDPTEDMLRWKKRWIRLGERLHPGEYAKKYPKTCAAFGVLRNDTLFSTFNGSVERALGDKAVTQAVTYLNARPGDFARRLDHLLRVDDTTQEAVLDAFAQAANKVSTPVLLQARHHFATRGQSAPLRVFFPKGNVAKAHAERNTLPALPDTVCVRAAEICEQALMARFRLLPPLGKVYVDAALNDYVAPFAARSASRAFCTLTRGSKVPLSADCGTLRFFVWWKNGADTTDIDLSAVLFDAEFNYQTEVAYYNLKEFSGCHSGDIVDAPQGASEFIDITLDKVRERGARYVVMLLNSYTQQPYCDLPECFAGWMARTYAESGEIYEPKTVQDRLDITANTRIALPLIIDIVERKVIWCDMALKHNPCWVNNAQGNLTSIGVTLQSLASLNKPTLYELFMLHARSRGTLTVFAEEADVVFSVEAGTPFRQEEVASEYMR